MKHIVAFLLTFSVVFLHAQAGRDETLAKSYMQNGEFDKAAELWQSLWDNSGNDYKYYSPLFRTLLELKRYDELERVIRKQMKKSEWQQQLSIDLGYVYLQVPDANKAKEQWDKVVKDLKPTESNVRSIAQYFEQYRAYDYALAVYDKGNKLMKDNFYFSFEMANVYMNKNDMGGAVKNYLDYFEQKPENVQLIKNAIQSSAASEKLLSEMETQLYGKIQRSASNDDYIDLLIWVHIQNKDFESALLQAKALDKRKNESGMRVLNLARMAQAESDYNSAVAAYEYIIAKGKENPIYMIARSELLNCRKEKIAKSIQYTTADLESLKSDYIGYINEYGRSFRAAQSMKELADLEGFYLHDLNSAIELCNEIIAMPGVNYQLKNQTKLSLGDFYLIGGDIWESTLLYSQVDKDEKDSPLGEEARFRNAKLAYYKGDFEWAQTQLEALKSSTTELISNDAINLSVFIIDNLGLDTTEAPMQMYARAELLLYQNQDDAATALLDTITYLFPGHALYDDIEYLKAQIFVRKKLFDKAVPLLEDIIKNYKTDLKGDDATFMLAEITEKQIGNKEKARELYQAIITDYNSSLLVIEARKRYRLLRGDKIAD